MLKKFIIFSDKDDFQRSGLNRHEPVLLNLDHIASIKPIRIVNREQTINGYWIRTTTGKKYKAVQIPTELQNLLNDDSTLTPFDEVKEVFEESSVQ